MCLFLLIDYARQLPDPCLVMRPPVVKPLQIHDTDSGVLVKHAVFGARGSSWWMDTSAAVDTHQVGGWEKVIDKPGNRVPCHCRAWRFVREKLCGRFLPPV